MFRHVHQEESVIHGAHTFSGTGTNQTTALLSCKIHPARPTVQPHELVDYALGRDDTRRQMIDSFQAHILYYTIGGARYNNPVQYAPFRLKPGTWIMISTNLDGWFPPTGDMERRPRENETDRMFSQFETSNNYKTPHPNNNNKCKYPTIAFLCAASLQNTTTVCLLTLLLFVFYCLSPPVSFQNAF